MPDFDYSIAVFGVNEGRTIYQCLSSIYRACAGRRAHIAVLLNGTTDNSIDIVKSMRLSHAAISVYVFPAADKANCINRFLYDLRRSAAVYFCVDAYAEISASAFHTINDALEANPTALIASGIPVNGRSALRSATEILRGGSVTGQLYGMSPRFCDRLVAMGLRLPLELYRGDGLLGSMAAHNFDAMGTPWKSERIIGVANATFRIPSLSVFKWGDIRRQYLREIRQARGRFEIQAIKSIIYGKGYEGLPGNASDMIKEWLHTNRRRPRSLRDRYFSLLAIRQLAAPRLEPDALAPRLGLEHG